MIAYGLRRNRRERRACLLDLRQDEIHRLHLANAKRAPAPTNEAEHEASFGEQIGGETSLPS